MKENRKLAAILISIPELLGYLARQGLVNLYAPGTSESAALPDDARVVGVTVCGQTGDELRVVVESDQLPDAWEFRGYFAMPFIQFPGEPTQETQEAFT